MTHSGYSHQNLDASEVRKNKHMILLYWCIRSLIVYLIVYFPCFLILLRKRVKKKFSDSYLMHIESIVSVFLMYKRVDMLSIRECFLWLTFEKLLMPMKDGSYGFASKVTHRERGKGERIGRNSQLFFFPYVCILSLPGILLNVNIFCVRCLV